MRKTVKSAFALMALLAAACDPGAGIRAAVRLTPSPDAGCIESALANSSLLARAELVDQDTIKKSVRRLFHVTFRDSSYPDPRAGLTVEARADSTTEIATAFFWVGRRGFVPDSTRAWMATHATSLTAQLRAACAPLSPDTTVCLQVHYPGKDIPCALAM